MRRQRLFVWTTLMILFGLIFVVEAPVAGTWSDITTATNDYKDGTATYMTWSPLRPAMSGTVSRLRIAIKSFGSPTEVRLALYDQNGNNLTEGKALVQQAGYLEVPVPAVTVTEGASYFLGAQAASDQLYRFACGAANGGFEAGNTYSAGLPARLPTGGWGDKLLTGGIYLEGGPTADFTATPTTRCAPLDVAFTDRTAGQPTAWLWDFGDGTTSLQQNPVHRYEVPGVYTVTLTATNPYGSDTRVRQNYITVEQDQPPGPLDYLVSVEPAAHRKFGLIYPATYRFRIPDGSTGLNAQYRYWTGEWHLLPEKGAAEIFNGIDAVRFDYTAGYAYVSKRFDRETDSFYLRIVDTAGQPVAATFDAIPRYYDNRVSAATITLDDWHLFNDSYFVTAADYLKTLGLHFTVGIITDDVPWDSVQRTIDLLGNQMEVASHSVNHTCDYTGNTYQAEVIGSRDAIGRNLVYDGAPLVPTFIEPCGYSDATLQFWLTAGNYLLTRSTISFEPEQATFVPWLPEEGRYGRAGTVFDDWDYRDNDGNLLRDANAAFDRTMAGGTIYLLLDHPWRNDHWQDGSFLLQHLDYIRGRSNVWYAPLGHLYQYHYLQEGRGGLLVQQVQASKPAAEFSAAPLSGAPPLAVTFTDSSSGIVTDRLWDFGDGMTSTLQNPVHLYADIGTYSVTLTVTGPGGSATVTRNSLVQVAMPTPPVAAFTAIPTTGTAPLSVTFTDVSTGTVSSCVWDFGDGSSSTLQNPVHDYAAGSFTATLTVTGPAGSSTTSTAITVLTPPPVAEFAATPTSGTVPLSVAFTDSSTGGVTGWSWDFGDGSVSTVQNPTHVYATAGSFTVALTVTGPGGVATATKPAYIAVNLPPPPMASFSATPTSGTVPLSVAFTDSSTGGVTGWSWDFGDGSVSTVQNPTHVYAIAGSFTVALTVTGPGGVATATKPAYITVALPAAPTASFTATPTSGVVPLSVAFTDKSTGSATGWLWDFGDGTASTLRNPAHVYTMAGSFTVKLTVTGPGGESTSTKPSYITVNLPAAPTVSFSGTPTSGAAPLTVTFTNKSTGTITGWLWDFGDGTTSTLKNPVHSFSAGVFTVKLTVTGPGGSKTLTRSSYIKVTPKAGFTATPVTGVAPLTVAFTNTSVGPATTWYWSFGDGTSSNLENPVHVYTRSGTYTVRLTATGAAGSNTLTRRSYIVVR